MEPTPKTVGDITLPWLQEAISREHPNVQVTDFDLDASVGDLGYLGSICRLNLSFGTNRGDLPDGLIVKLPSEDEGVLANGNQMGAYSNEANFYRHLANQGVGRAPRYYFSAAEPGTTDYIIGIEDLSPFRFVSQTEGAKISDCHTVMRSLANMHGKFWQDDQLGTGWLGSIADWSHMMGPLIETGLKPYTENFGQFLPPWFMDKFEAGANAYGNVCRHLGSGQVTLMHGDTHIRNLAFEDGHADPVRFYDWQLTCRGPGAYDVLYFMVNSLPVAEQKEHLEPLLRTYHDSLSEHVSDYSIDDLKRDMAVSSLTLFGFIAVLGNILPPNEATIELVRETTPRYIMLMEHFNAEELIDEFA